MDRRAPRCRAGTEPAGVGVGVAVGVGSTVLLPSPPPPPPPMLPVDFTTETVTVSVSHVPLGSETFSRNVSVVSASKTGAVKSGVAVEVSASDIFGPLTCIQLYASLSPSGSLVPVPTSATCTDGSTVLSDPAFAVSGRLGTNTCWVVVFVAPSLFFVSQWSRVIT